MFFVNIPDATPIYYDPEEAYLEYQRREYVRRVQEEKQRVLFERELQLEEARHRAALEHIAQQEQQRRRQIAQFQAQQQARAQQQAQARAEAANRYPRQQQQQQYARYPTQEMYESQQARPTPREILARRLAREQEEERRSRQFHQNILSHIFGVPPEEFEQSMDEDYEEEEEPQTEEQPTLAQLINEYSKHQQLPELSPPIRKDSVSQPMPTPASTSRQPESVPVAAAPTSVPAKAAESTSQEVMMETETEEPLPEPEEAHWSSAPERARSLAQITAIERSFDILKSTFVFPSGPLERLSTSTEARLAYNATNAPVHAYEHGLGDLLSKLDGIESYGFKGIREARKQLVVKIEQELENLDKKITERLTGGDGVTVAPAAPSNSEGAEAKEKELSTVSSLPKDPVDAMTVPTPALQLDSDQPSTAIPPTDSASNDKMDTSETPAAAAPAIPAGEPVKSAEASTAPGSSLPSDTTTTIPTLVGDAPKSDAYTTKIAAVNADMAPTDLAKSIPLPETMSDEELEIEDAIRIDLTDNESKDKTNELHKSAVGEFEML